MRIRGPLVQTVRPGETVRFDCGAKPKIKIEVKQIMTMALMMMMSPTVRPR